MCDINCPWFFFWLHLSLEVLESNVVGGTVHLIQDLEKFHLGPLWGFTRLCIRSASMIQMPPLAVLPISLAKWKCTIPTLGKHQVIIAVHGRYHRILTYKGIMTLIAVSTSTVVVNNHLVRLFDMWISS